MADQYKVSAAIVAESEKRSFVFKIHGYSKLKELLKNGECVASPHFSVEGHNWFLRFYPNGYLEYHGAFICLLLDAVDDKSYVNAEASDICVLGDDGLPAPSLVGTLFSSVHSTYLGYNILREELDQQSWDIMDEDGCLSIKCDLIIKKDIQSEETTGNQFVLVPPSDLHRHFGNLLESMVGADVTFHVGGEKFLAHKFVLAARSSVFNAELLGAMKESVSTPIVIHEMEPDVFKSLLHFIYTDSLPVLEMACNQGEARPDVAMASHLLVAADRYNVERLKLICEHKLCSRIDANMVATSLVLAQQHNCNGLKEACLQFLSSPSNLEAVVLTDGYEYLKLSCPSVLKELIARLLPVEMKAAKDIVMAI
ncbi:BTB/POZ and MATH domain-containing protein 2-like [Lolium rigidum]|uniref:BTB/POZ and MATH domain-containing protein 2-like n=1 Tax=Lolium rigidum TaxID=89674 RepID=UPI001F5C507D|nr:BTB/POZ and MATH domain-containing protein 2-like [Lolium rigidum]